MQLLNDLEGHIRMAKSTVASMIGHLVDFKNDLTQLKRTTGRAQWAMQVSLDLHVQILKSALERLRQSKVEITSKRRISDEDAGRFATLDD